MPSRPWLTAGWLFIALWPATVRADFQQGVDDYERGDYSAAYQEFLSAAQRGDGAAAYALGFMYLTGKGVPQSNNQAIEWYRRGADLGYGEAPPPAAGGKP
jgi:TPR repeat protein